MADMDKRKYSGEVLHREFEITRNDNSIDVDKRTVRLAFSSELPVARYFGKEILSHEPGACDLSRMMDGQAPLLVNHDPNQHVGIIESAAIDNDRKGRCVVRFGSSAMAQEIFRDVQDGIRRMVSVGYKIADMVLEKGCTDDDEDGLDTYRVTNWTPVEVSLASVPADASVGVGRSLSKDTASTITITKNLMSDIAVLDKMQIEKDMAARCAAILELEARCKTEAGKHACREAIREGKSLDDARCAVLESEFNAKPVTQSATIGMSKDEVRQFSIVKAIHSIASKRSLDGIEREASDAVAKQFGKTPNDSAFFIPYDVMANGRGGARALQSNVFSGASALIATNLQPTLIELLRNEIFVAQMGATTLSGLVGNVAIPRQTTAATCYWVADAATVTASQQAFGQLELSPKTLSASTAYTRQLLAQSSIDVENIVRSDLMMQLAIEKDRAAIDGTGNSGQPLGILQWPSADRSTSVTFTSAANPTYAEVVSFETNLAANNAARGNLGYLVHPSVRGNARTRALFSNTGLPLWTGSPNSNEGQVLGYYPARATNQVPSATSTIFGRWDDLILADWANGYEVIVDPYSLSISNQVRIVIMNMTDINCKRRKSFAVSTN